MPSRESKPESGTKTHQKVEINFQFLVADEAQREHRKSARIPPIQHIRILIVRQKNCAYKKHFRYLPLDHDAVDRPVEGM